MSFWIGVKQKDIYGDFLIGVNASDYLTTGRLLFDPSRGRVNNITRFPPVSPVATKVRPRWGREVNYEVERFLHIVVERIFQMVVESFFQMGVLYIHCQVKKLVRL